jgi:hypothetical protein
MRNLFAIAFVLVSMFVVSGCFSSHGRPDFVISMEDSGPFVGGDAGPTEPDAGPVVMADAGTDSGPVVVVDGGPEVPAIIVEPYAMRNSTILVADDGATWQQVGSYRFHSGEGIPAVTAVDVIFDGDAADLTMIGIAADGLVYGDVLPSGVGSTKHIILDAPIAADTDGFGHFQIWAKIARVVPLSTVSGADIGSCTSGDHFRAGAYSVEGLISSTLIGTTFDAIYGNEFQIRKSKPTITSQTLSTTTLSNGSSQDCYKFQGSADSAGSVSFHSVPFNAVSNGELTLSNFGLRKGSSLMDTADYDIVDELGNNLEAGTVSFSTGEVHWVIIVFRNDGETVSGSGNTYTLFATPSGVDAGDAVSFTFHHTGNGSTGYLLNDPAHSSLDTSAWGFPETGPVVEAGFIWSDLSELPHSNLTGIAGGSRDWTDGRYIEDLTQTTTLSR